MSSASTHRGQDRDVGTSLDWHIVIGIPATDRDGTPLEQARDGRSGVRDGLPQVADAAAGPRNLERPGAGEFGKPGEEREPQLAGA
ncbi:MAG: hypothetical protein RLZZ21_1785 [Planctomycetota bacterium]|jgi:hypothetical protein